MYRTSLMRPPLYRHHKRTMLHRQSSRRFRKSTGRLRRSNISCGASTTIKTWIRGWLVLDLLVAGCDNFVRRWPWGKKPCWKLELETHLPMHGRTIIIMHSSPGIHSSCWLISKGREREGLAGFIRFHGGGDENNPLVIAQFREIKETISFEQQNKFESYRAWWKTFVGLKSNRYRGFILISLGIFEQTIGSSIITFYLSSVLDLAGVTSEKSQFAINLGQNCVAFISALIGICFIDKLGRVKMLVGGTLFCAAVLACMAGLTAQQTDNPAGRNAIISMVFLFQMGYSSTWTPLSFSYCAEVLNFTIRAKGMAFYNIFTSSAGFINQYVISIGLANIGWRFYIIGVCWNIFAATVIAFTYLETKGLSLEQIDKRFEGIPRDQLDDIIETYNGMKPISEAELGKVPVEPVSTEMQVNVKKN
ncbi:hypothetical protein ONS95_005715 [Cadophora gregata]|uniref:uncharacterized protein n=1 Tax=Cadophora gregata TaxID=51156 RepID=UPI0026DC0E54|nr:uncharacterized protein ONS95_005715 [Cadophora gregata]KAK0103708.1 hypothetical protein ONS95_005715 [Cadophora gregata]KAK0107898.1 hypothetical protein ONS96_003685 [Cadophora gregata f. sp. sojae]